MVDSSNCYFLVICHTQTAQIVLLIAIRSAKQSEFEVCLTTFQRFHIQKASELRKLHQ